MWIVETVDRDGAVHLHYRHGTMEEVEEGMWLDFPDHVIVDLVPQVRDDVETQELNFDLD